MARRHTPTSEQCRAGEVVAWRSRRLQRVGFDRVQADALAADPRTDVHALLELIDRGCPAHLAARIVAPLDDDRTAPR
jgi:hypothetical protein